MEGKKLFRGALFGYNKADVISYIEEAAKTVNERVELESSRADRAEESVDNLSQRIEVLEKELEAARLRADSCDKEISKLNEEKTNLIYQEKQRTYELTRIKSLYSVKEDELTYQKSINESLSNRVSEMEETASRYSSDKGRIADAIIGAQEAAQNIIHEANTEALQIKEQAKEYTENIKIKINSFCDEVRQACYKLEDCSRQISGSADGVVFYIDGIEKDLDELLMQIFTKEDN
jgi:chromosome segregation ATPase